MHRKVIYMVLVFMVSLPLYGYAQETNPQTVFDQANKQLKDGNIHQSLELYRSIEGEGQISGALFLNMALNYMRLDSAGMAKYYFLKAGEYEETASAAAKGLQFVENQFSHQSVILPALPWERALNWLGNVLGSATLLVIALILINVGVFIIIITWFVKKSAYKKRVVAYTIAGLGLALMALSFYVDYRTQRYSKAVMVSTQTNVYTKPKAEASVVNKAFEGYTSTVDHKKTASHDQWRYVRMSNGVYGWIPASEIKVL